MRHRSGSTASSETVGVAARGAYEDLARVSTPLIGRVGVEALAARAVHLAQREHAWLDAADETAPANADEPFAGVAGRMARQDHAVATEGAAAIFAVLAGLLVTFIGEPLTMSLMRRAWPEAFSDMHIEET